MVDVKFLTTIICFVIAVITYGSPTAAQAPNPLTVDEVIYMESAREFDISSDGQWVVWVKSTPDKKDSKFKRNIFLSSTRDTITLQITRTTKNYFAPAFSPDGNKIAFLSRRDKKQ
ncbi:MAG: PD40 domain-containing protein, partial [Candidatus Latescibacterota bacterium]